MLVTCISISAALSDAIYLEILGINLLLHCKNVTQFFPSFKHKSLLYYLYYALDASGFLEKSTFLSTWQAYSACIDNIGSRAQGNVDLLSVMLLIHAGQKYSCSSQFTTVESDFQAENSVVLLTT